MINSLQKILLLSVFALLISCNEKKAEPIKVSETIDYTEMGLQYATETQKVLGKNLLNAIEQKGLVGALTFCNEKAIPLTDSMAVYHKATIKRISDKNRNPDNRATLEELNYIEQFKNDVISEKEWQPIVKEETEKVSVYSPIITNGMCLQCHGKPETLNTDVHEKIKQLYPNDLATGYSENEVRGIWSITFAK